MDKSSLTLHLSDDERCPQISKKRNASTIFKGVNEVVAAIKNQSMRVYGFKPSHYWIHDACPWVSYVSGPVSLKQGAEVMRILKNIESRKYRVMESGLELHSIYECRSYHGLP